MNWVAYHDRTSADHQAQFDRLFLAGWRMIAISVYGLRGDERYAAIWVERPGPDWSAVHGVDFAGYQAAFDNAVAFGFRPVLIAASGPANNPVFAGTFEQSSQPVPLTRHGLRSGVVSDLETVEHWNDQARRNNWLPTCIAVYGDRRNLRYAGIWEPNTEGICWSMEGLADSARDYQARFDALAPVGGMPALAAISPSNQYASIFRDDPFPGWIARHNMTSATYQRDFDRLVGQGYVPIVVQGGGSGRAPRFSALFARSFDRVRPVWHQPTGPVTVSAIDAVMERQMRRHRIRSSALALVRGARLIYARGYTWAEPGYPAAQPTTRFRQASVSKFIIALAIHRLVQDRRLAFDTPIQSVLNLQRPDGSGPSPSFAMVQVRHLLEHTSGLPANPYGIEPEVVAAFNTVGSAVSLPVNGRMTDQYLTTLPAAAPPTTPAYSNWGYFLLGHVAMAVTGHATLDDALDELLFRPLGITRIRTSRTRIEDQQADEARYHPTQLGVGASLVEPDRRPRGIGYGGFWNLERDDASGGLSGAVVDVARLLAMLDVRRNNPILNPATIGQLFSMASAGGGHGFDGGWVINATNGLYYGIKGGALPESSQNCIRYQTNDISMVICWGRSNIGESNSDAWWYPDFPEVLNIARAHPWSPADLFPQFGMASF